LIKEGNGDDNICIVTEFSPVYSVAICQENVKKIRLMDTVGPSIKAGWRTFG